MAEAEGTMGTAIQERLRDIPELIADCKAVADNFRKGYRHEPPTNAALWDRMHRELSAAYDSLEKQRDEADGYVDQLNALCEDFGCDAGSDRLAWLHEKLGERDALKLKVEEIEARLLDPVAVHANMLRGTIAMPSLTNFLHAMGSHALTCIRETVKIAKRNEQSVYIDQAEHLLSIVKGSDLREADAAIKEAGK